MIKIELTEEEAILTRTALRNEAMDWNNRIVTSNDNQDKEKLINTHITVTNAQKKVEKALGFPLKENK